MPQTIAYIAGDIHAGAADGSGSAFPAWLDGLAALPPARLVLLGDLFEFWTESAGCLARHEPVLRRLRALGRLGWRVEAVRGNREAVAGRGFEVAAGCRLHDRIDLAAGGLTVRVVHGDRLIHDPGYRAYAALMRSPAFALFRALNPGPVHEAIARWLRGRSQARQRRPRRRIFLDPRRVAAAARGVDRLVAGHIHEHWRRRIGGVDLTLVGDWPDGHASWVEVLDDGSLVQRSSCPDTECM